MRSFNPNRIVWNRPLVLLVLMVGTVLGMASTAGAAAPRPLLVEKHKEAGLTCDACHKESPPKAAVTASVCLGCHGDYAKLAERTQEAKPKNPHESHEGEIECEECHHVHKTSVDYCAKCHDFGFKVP